MKTTLKITGLAMATLMTSTMHATPPSETIKAASEWATLGQKGINLGLEQVQYGFEKAAESLNAIGDLIMIDTEGLTFENYNALHGDRQLTFSFPQTGGKKGFAFKPTSGDLKNQDIKVVAISTAGVNTQEQGRVIFYRQLKGEQLWTEVGTVVVSHAGNRHLNQLQAVVTLKADGTVEFINAQGNRERVLVGKRILM